VPDLVSVQAGATLHDHSQRKKGRTMITIGIDAHKHLHVATARTRPGGARPWEGPNSPTLNRRCWPGGAPTAGRAPRRCGGIEGAGHYGGACAGPPGAGERVYDINRAGPPWPGGAAASGARATVSTPPRWLAPLAGGGRAGAPGAGGRDGGARPAGPRACRGVPRPPACDQLHALLLQLPAVQKTTCRR